MLMAVTEQVIQDLMLVVEMVIAKEKVSADVTVVDYIVGRIDVVLGMDVIEKLGGVTVGGKTLQFGKVACSLVGCYKVEVGGFSGRCAGGSSDIMMVESANVGKMIRLGGSKIRNLEHNSNARIKTSWYGRKMKMA